MSLPADTLRLASQDRARFKGLKPGPLPCPPPTPAQLEPYTRWRPNVAELAQLRRPAQMSRPAPLSPAKLGPTILQPHASWMVKIAEHRLNRHG